MKILDGRELVGFVKERQAQAVREMRGRGVRPKLVILRDSDNPVITKYVELKKRYGEDIGIEVEDFYGEAEKIAERIAEGNADAGVSGMIVQLPLAAGETDRLVAQIAPQKDVDGLSGQGDFDPATATAVNWLMAGYDISLTGAKIAIVGRGRLVGRPLAEMWRASGLDVTVFHRGSKLAELAEYDVVVSATGQAGIIKAEMIKPGAVVVDAGTASEGGVLVGDVADEIRERGDLAAITPKIGGVGPLTVGALMDNVITAAGR